MKQGNNSAFSSEIPSREWVEERKNYIGGSDVAAILGESSYSTPLQVWLRKKGLIEPVDSTPIMEFGNVFEPVMADHYSHTTGLKTRRVNQSFTHSEQKFLRANIDRQILNGEGVDGTGVLELKTTTSHRLRSLDGEYPIEWLYQIQTYHGLTGYAYAYLFIYERDSCKYYEPILIKQDEQWIAKTQEKLIRWWQRHMIEGIRPNPVNGEDALLLYPDASDGKVVETSAEDPSNYPGPDEGLHSAALVDAVNLGTLETPWGPKEKVSLIFELQSTDEDGRHFIVGKHFTRSLNEKAALRQFLHKWRGIKYTSAELQQGIDLENLIGMSATLFIVLNETEERTYANIESILPYKNKHGDIDHFALQPSGEYTRVINRDGYKESGEYAGSANGPQG